MPALTDQELVAACLQGKESAYALLVERFAPRLFRIASRICRDQQDAEDAVQEAFMQAIRDLGTWRPIAPLEAWMVTITVRTAQKIDQRANRLASRTEPLEPKLPDGNTKEIRDTSSLGDPAAVAGQADLSTRLAAAVANLPQNYRVAVSLRYQEGLSPKEIAEVLGIPERTVRTHLLRGLRALKGSATDLR